MKTKTILYWFLLAVILASGAARATVPDRGSRLSYDDALQVTWLQGESRGKAIIHNDAPRLTLEKTLDSSAIRAFYPVGGSPNLSDRQLALTLYALGCAVYLAFIFLLGLFVGFNDLDKDK